MQWPPLHLCFSPEPLQIPSSSIGFAEHGSSWGLEPAWVPKGQEQPGKHHHHPGQVEAAARAEGYEDEDGRHRWGRAGALHRAEPLERG